MIILSILAVFCANAHDNRPEASEEVEYYRVVGAVIDTSGNPLPGALVKSGEGIEALTDDDGTFSIFLAPGDEKLTASYPGFISKKMGIKKQPVVIELKEKPNTQDPDWVETKVPTKVTYR